MKFGPVPLADAPGAILAHSVAGLRKGRHLTASDLAQLAAAGVAEVVVARLSADDLHEDAAAAQLATALVPDMAGQGLRLTPATTGRVNIHATSAGVILIDSAAISALNSVNPLITLATLAPFRRVAAAEMVGTVKIIAYGVPRCDVEAACRQATGALRLARPVLETATLIETTVTGDAPPTKGRDALRLRLLRFGIRLTDRIVCPHHPKALADELGRAPGEALFILTASATSDPADVGPAALRLSGGTVTRFGMPVDPGNLLFLGALGDRPVIGLPGCARSPALNGADWVMERVLCGLRVSAEDVAAMGVGGLLKESPARGRPRDSAADPA
jgi:molybdenum cofactor cytidylyltransferase